MPLKNFIDHPPGMKNISVGSAEGAAMSCPGDDVEQGVFPHVGSARFSSRNVRQTELPRMRVRKVMGMDVEPRQFTRRSDLDLRRDELETDYLILDLMNLR